jgi:Tol biopolymer transport system component
MNADGSDKRRLDTGSLYGEVGLAFSPDGDEVAFSCSVQSYGYERDICTTKGDGSGFTNVTNTPNKVEYSYTWSPSGEWLAFGAKKCSPIGCGVDEGPKVSTATFKIKADGSSLTRLTPDRPSTEEPDVGLSWSPDGRRIAFSRLMHITSDGDPFNALFTMKPNGTEIIRLTRVYGTEGYAAWSPDSKHILYSYNAPCEDSDVSYCSVGGLRKMRADGTNKVHLTKNPHDGRYLWAPNGKRILFQRATYDVLVGTTFYFYTMAPDGSDKRLVYTNPHGVEGYDWQPRP